MPIAYRIPVDAAYQRRAQQVTGSPDERGTPGSGSAPWLRWGTRLALTALLLYLGALRDWTGVVLVGLGLLGSFGAEILQRRSAQRSRERAVRCAGELLIDIDDAGLTAADGHSRDTLPWTEFADAAEHPDGVMLTLNSRGGYWLPDSALTEGTPAQIRNLIGQHLGRVRV
jgi:YcxB-like protein